jgi:4-hydroxyphenylpyruvate dioxygenase-like putative hemolysin
MADMQEHKAAVAKYASKVNDQALEKMAKSYALVLSNKDSQFVSCGDASEKDTVRENFLKKKLGLANSDTELDSAIDEICQTMKEDRFKSRLAFYYLLAEKFNKLSMFA